MIFFILQIILLLAVHGVILEWPSFGPIISNDFHSDFPENLSNYSIKTN